MTPGIDTLPEILTNPQVYPDAPRSVELRETHISWVFLTDRYAYKLKKPVKFDFLDFSTPRATLRSLLRGSPAEPSLRPARLSERGASDL